MLVTGLATEFQCPRGFPQIHTTISELASQNSWLCAKPAQSFPFAKGGSVAPWQGYDSFHSDAALRRRTSCKPRAHVQGYLTEPGTQAGWWVKHRSLQEHTKLQTEMTVWLQTWMSIHKVLFSSICVCEGQRGWGVKITYLRKGKLWEKQVCNLGFSQKTPAEFPLFAFNYQPQKTIA